ncbi:MAG: hypothetical protein ABI354_01095 [Candidatus Saccharimonadales bacterium]
MENENTDSNNTNVPNEQQADIASNIHPQNVQVVGQISVTPSNNIFTGQFIKILIAIVAMWILQISMFPLLFTRANFDIIFKSFQCSGRDGLGCGIVSIFVLLAIVAVVAGIVSIATLLIIFKLAKAKRPILSTVLTTVMAGELFVFIGVTRSINNKFVLVGLGIPVVLAGTALTAYITTSKGMSKK